MKRTDYPRLLKECNLSKEQTAKLREIIQDLTVFNRKIANAKSNFHTAFYEGKASGLNTVDRFLRGDMDAHDEFEDED